MDLHVGGGSYTALLFARGSSKSARRASRKPAGRRPSRKPARDARTRVLLPKRIALILFLVAVMLAPIAMLITISRFGVNVPYWDDWAFIRLVVEAHNGMLSFSRLWEQHNEHRLLVVRVITVIISNLTDHNVVAQMYAGLAFQFLTLALLWSIIKTSFRQSQSALIPWLTILASLCLFSTVQAENWIWGMASLVWFLSNLCAAGTVWALVRWPARWRGVLTALAFTCVGICTAAIGLTLWGVGLLGILINGLIHTRRIEWLQLVVWTGSTGALIGLYLIGYRKPVNHPDILFFVSHPSDFVIYIFAYLGSPFNHASIGYPLCVAMGLAGVTVLGAGIYYVARRLPEMRIKLIPWFLLACYVLSNALITAVGRAGFGPQQAITSRYSSPALLLWICVFVVASIILHHWFTRGYRRAVLAITLSAVTVLGTAYVIFYIQGYQQIKDQSHKLQSTIPFLYEYEMVPDDSFRPIAPGPSDVRSFARLLHVNGLGLFSQGNRSDMEQRARSIASLPPAGPSRYISLDVINGYNPQASGQTEPIIINSRLETFINISGWAIDFDAQARADGVYINVDGVKDILTLYGLDRGGVAAYFGDPRYQYTGFSSSFPTAAIGVGRHTLTLKMIASDKRRYYISEKQFLIEIQ